MKKFFALILALIMVFSLATVAVAAGDDGNIVDGTTKGSITASGVGNGTTYSIYKMLNLASTSKEGDKTLYTYTVTTEWQEFFNDEDIQAYFGLSEAGYVTWKKDINDQKAAADVAKLAMVYANENNIEPTAYQTATADNVTLKFENLELGYYLIDSSMGALCGLTTTNPNAALTAKNKAPTIDKQVLEDSTSQWGDNNSADIGQIIEYRVTIDVHAGAQNYVLHDEMVPGLTYQSVSKIEHIIPGISGTEGKTETVEEEYYTVKTGNLEDDCDFEVEFTKEFCDHLNTNDKVVVYYSAMLNRNAVIAGDGNVNKAYLSFGDDHFTTADQTQTYTYEIDLVKTNDDDVMLSGAIFRIYDSASGGNEIKVVPLMKKQEDGSEVAVVDERGNQIYRRARADENTGVAIEVKDGIAVVIGLDNGTYYLEEVTPPDGYNKLDGRVEFTIAGANLKASYNDDDVFETGSGVHVVNQAGNRLPETGAMGTTLFITFGMFVMLGTGVLLVTKKRMSMIQE